MNTEASRPEATIGYTLRIPASMYYRLSERSEATGETIRGIMLRSIDAALSMNSDTGEEEQGA